MAKATVAKHVNHYQSITDSILEALNQGVKPWARPWTTRAGAELLDAGLLSMITQTGPGVIT